MDLRAKELVSIGNKLFTKKSTGLDSLCQDIAEQVYPWRADFTTTRSIGDDLVGDLMDSFPVQAREMLGNAPQSMLRQGEWFAVRTGYEELDEDPTNARWLEYATKRFRRIIYDRRANLVRALTEVDHDYVSFGYGVCSVEESPDRDHMLFRAWHPKECAWMENSVGRVDHLQRDMPMTARNMVKRFKGKVDPEITRIAETEPSKEIKVRHIVLPVDEVYGDDRAKRRKYRDMPFLSLYVDVERESILGEAGLPVFCYVVPRWRIVNGVPYSPAALASLPDARMLQSLSRILLEAGEKAVDPAMFAKGEIFRDTVNRYAGGMTYVDMESDQDIRNAIYTEETPPGLGFGGEMKADVRNLIAEAFLLNKLMLPSAREMTAFETQARLDEFRRAALPFFGPIESEYHLPLLDVAFQMSVRNGQFDFEEMPDALAGADVTFTFESPLNTAEGRKNVAAFQESVQILAGAAQFDQTIPATMDFQKMTKDAVKGTGAQADWFKDEEQAQSDEEAAAATARLQQTAVALREGAGVATDVAGAAVAMREAGLPV